jgi:hypothetical protein
MDREIAIDGWGPPERFPEELSTMLDPSKELDPQVLYYPEKVQPGLLGKVALPFAGLFFLLALIVGPGRLLMGADLDSGGVLGTLTLSVLMTFPGLVLLWQWRKEMSELYEKTTGGWRQGVFIAGDWLLFYLGEKHALAIRKAQVERITYELPSEDAPRKLLKVGFTSLSGEDSEVILRESVEPSADALHEELIRWRDSA